MSGRSSRLICNALLGGATLLVAGCGRGPDEIHEKDLLKAKCTLVERMNFFGGFLSDADFDLGVKCPNGDGEPYREIFKSQQDYKYVVIAKAPQPGEPRAVEIAYCDEPSRAQVRERLDQLNVSSQQTGMTFTLRPELKRCDLLESLPGALTGPSKNFDRQLK